MIAIVESDRIRRFSDRQARRGYLNRTSARLENLLNESFHRLSYGILILSITPFAPPPLLLVVSAFSSISTPFDVANRKSCI
jgi:hypothetical protein